MDLAQAREIEEKFMAKTYKRFPILFKGGKGHYLFDDKGEKYLDFTTGLGVNIFGYGNEDIIKAAVTALKHPTHVSNWFYSESASKLSFEIVKNTPFARAFFSNSGTEANECALKAARLYGKKISEDKIEFIAFHDSFHGRSMGSSSVTWKKNIRENFYPLIPNVKFVPFNDCEAFKSAISDKTAAVIVEPIQGEGGVMPATENFMKLIRELTEKHNALFIADEVQCGAGRTGKFFAFEHYNVVPDIATLGKGLGGGFPFGATLFSKKVENIFGHSDHGSTFGGNEFCCKVALEVLSKLKQESFLKKVENSGERIKHSVERLAHNLPKYKNPIIEVRGMGMMIGIELRVKVDPYIRKALDKGLIINGTHETTIRLLPPYTIKRHEIDLAMDMLKEVFMEIEFNNEKL